MPSGFLPKGLAPRADKVSVINNIKTKAPPGDRLCSVGEVVVSENSLFAQFWQRTG